MRSEHALYYERKSTLKNLGGDRVELSSIEADLMRNMHRFTKLDMSLIIKEVSHGEFKLLQVIKKCTASTDGLVKVSDLAEMLKVSVPAVSRMLGLLEEKELIERTVDKKNRRNTYVKLTDQGLFIYEEIWKKLQSFIQQVIEQMGEENVLQFIALSDRWLNTMEKTLKELNK